MSSHKLFMKNNTIKERKKIFIGIKDIVCVYKKSFLLLFTVQFLFLVGCFLGPYLYGVLIDDILIGKKIELLLWICLGYLAIYSLDTVLTVIQKKVGVNVYNSIKSDVRRKIWKNYMRSSFLYFEEKGNGDLKQRIDTDTNAIETFMNDQVIIYIYNSFSLFAYLCVIFIISWKLASFSMLMVPIVFWLTKCMTKGSGQAWGNYRADYGKYENWLQGSLQNWKEIKVLNAQESQLSMFTSHWGNLRKHFYRGSLYFFINRSFIGFSNFFITKMNIYFIGGLLIFNGSLKVGLLFVFIKYYEKFFACVTNITSANMKLQEYKESLERVIEVLNKDFYEEEKKDIIVNAGKITFDNVSFRYYEDGKDVLKNINFELKDKQCLAMVGKSGSGKSTIIKLILGLYQNYCGNIYLCDNDLKTIKDDVIHANITAVMQDSILYNGSIIENMCMIKKDVSLEEIIKACKEANIHDEIEKMTNGYETVIGEKGVQLSGGQKQRIAIARALLIEPRILILDEATSALDSDSEMKIYNTIKKLKLKCTIIIIAHKMQSILLSDHVLVIDNSTIVEQGSYIELLKQEGVFNHLFKRQHEFAST